MLEEEDDLGVPTLSEMLACTRRPAAMQQISTTMASSKTTVGGSKAAAGPKAIAMATPSLTPPSASPSLLSFSGMASEGSKGASDNGGVERLNCPRCDSANTKFCYYNNYSLSQPRHFCKNCKRYWTAGGTLRTVPVGGGCRRNKSNKRPSSPSKPITTTIATTMTTNTDVPSSAVGADYPSSSSENSSRIGRPYEFHHNEDIMGGGGFLELSNASHHVASPQPPSMATLGGGSTTPSFLGLLVGSGDDFLLNYDGGDNDSRLLVNPIQALVPPLGVPGTSAYFKDGEVLDSKPDISNLEDKKVDVDERDRMGFARNNFSEKDSSWSQPWGNLQRLHNNSNSNGDDNPVVMGDEGGDNAKKRLKKGGGMLDWQVSPPPVCDNFNHDPPSIVDGYWTDQLSQYPLPGSGSPFT